MIYLPNDISNPPFSEKKYPVVYLLDGDSHFTSVVGMIQQFSQVNGNTFTPEMIVVGIPNTNRTRDLSPTKSEPNPPMAPKNLTDQSGGGKNFVSFMEKELFPYIEANYPTVPYRMFIGHSFGGLLVMDTLLDKPELFNSFIAIDPSMWWDNELLLDLYKNTDFNDSKYNNKTLYLGIANTLGKDLDIVSTREVKGPMTAHINSILDTRDVLNNINNKSFSFSSKFYENDNHGSVPLIATYDGLRYIFDFYQFEINFADVMAENTDIVDRMKAHYINVTKTLGYENKPDEAMINGMGYQLMQMDKVDLAGEFFKMNVDNYPKSFNVYDSLGDYYLRIKNNPEAIKSFEKALSLKENPGSRKKL
jgi:predicted alpha/beta superfamily hydrolase